LAVGTEEGFVCLFEVTSEGLDFDKVLDKQEGRILCLDWHTDGKHIVTGIFKQKKMC
jgi:U3 small nucleolar RNA-associated protein 4